MPSTFKQTILRAIMSEANRELQEPLSDKSNGRYEGLIYAYRLVEAAKEPK